jgi:hypothetical protein
MVAYFLQLACVVQVLGGQVQPILVLNPKLASDSHVTDDAIEKLCDVAPDQVGFSENPYDAAQPRFGVEFRNENHLDASSLQGGRP